MNTVGDRSEVIAHGLGESRFERVGDQRVTDRDLEHAGNHG